MFGDSLQDPSVNCVIDRGSSKTTNLKQVATFRQPTRQMDNFLFAVILKIDDYAPGRRFRDYPVERDDDDSGISGLFIAPFNASGEDALITIAL